MPGDSFSGKTTLVTELVRAGAEYYSDEYAVIDDQGLVHPFARPLSIRMPPPRQHDRTSVESLGGTIGEKPVPVGLIAATAYRPEAPFSPRRRSPGQGVLTLLAHSGRAHEQPQATLTALRSAASKALVLEGERGEAAAAAEILLEVLSESANGAGPEPTRAGLPSIGQNGDARDAGNECVAFEVYGATARVAVPGADLVPRVLDQLPLHATPCEPQPDDRRFALERAGRDEYAVVEGGSVQARMPSLENALAYLRYRLFHYAVHHARDHLVVSAGVVAHQGRAIVLPGPSRAGKTRLVAALLRAGAVYYADDWAVLDGDGMVHPYPTALFRLEGGKDRRCRSRASARSPATDPSRSA